jgi:proteasome lid subunit RPN8/RPN11
VTLAIAGVDLAAMRAAAEAAYPEECCGLMMGRRVSDAWMVDEVIACPNVAAEPEHRFEVDPKALIAAHRAARETDRQLIGPYHSHPNGRAEPSQHDRARASEAGAEGDVWLIVPVTEAGPGAPRAYRFAAGDFREIPIAARA